MKAPSSMLAIAMLLSAFACSKDKPAPQATTSEATVASAAPSAASSDRPRAHHASCPSRVRGATATASDVDGGVMISVSATDDATIEEIHARLGTLEAAANEGRRGRFCPEMDENTTRTVTSTKTGAEITLVPTNSAELPRVRADVRERLAHSEKRPD